MTGELRKHLRFSVIGTGDHKQRALQWCRGWGTSRFESSEFWGFELLEGEILHSRVPYCKRLSLFSFSNLFAFTFMILYPTASCFHLSKNQ